MLAGLHWTDSFRSVFRSSGPELLWQVAAMRGRSEGRPHLPGLEQSLMESLPGFSFGLGREVRLSLSLSASSVAQGKA